jgi:hypothetical protein
MHKVREAAIGKIKREVGTSPLLILEQDKQLQAVLASWKFIEFMEDRAPAIRKVEGLTLPQLVTAAWDGISYSAAKVSTLLSLHPNADEKVKQAAGLGLGYPDGTIHPLAEQWIAFTVQSLLKSKAGRKEK